MPINKDTPKPTSRSYRIWVSSEVYKLAKSNGDRWVAEALRELQDKELSSNLHVSPDVPQFSDRPHLIRLPKECYSLVREGSARSLRIYQRNLSNQQWFDMAILGKHRAGQVSESKCVA
jgi:hypothetical protein